MSQHRLHGLRGKAFVAEMKRIMAQDGEAIARSFHNRVKQNGGKFSAHDLGAIANEFRLPLTVLDDYLPELTRFTGEKRYPSGAWERLQENGVTAKMIGVEWGDDNGSLC